MGNKKKRILIFKPFDSTPNLFLCLTRISPTITAKVYLDVQAHGSKNSLGLKKIGGRIVLGLFGDSCPKTVDNFLSIIEGTEVGGDNGKSWLHYKASNFHR